MRSFVDIASLIWPAVSALLPSMTMRSMWSFGPSSIRNTTRRSPSGVRSVRGVIWTPKYPSSSYFWRMASSAFWTSTGLYSTPTRMAAFSRSSSLVAPSSPRS